MEDQKQNAQTEEAQEVFPLDDAAISLLADLRANIEKLDAQWNGALVLFIRQHKLKGNWGVAPNGRELIRQEPPK
jgi:hypothetical protein